MSVGVSGNRCMFNPLSSNRIYVIDPALSLQRYLDPILRVVHTYLGLGVAGLGALSKVH